MEEVARRAGVSRATLYQHFEVVVDPDPKVALDRTISNSVRFWATEDSLLSQIYGVAAIDPAAQSLVNRQRADRRGELERLVRNLDRAGRLQQNGRRALALLLVLTSYDSFRELRQAGLSVRQVSATLQETARELILT